MLGLSIMYTPRRDEPMFFTIAPHHFQVVRPRGWRKDEPQEVLDEDCNHCCCNVCRVFPITMHATAQVLLVTMLVLWSPWMNGSWRGTMSCSSSVSERWASCIRLALHDVAICNLCKQIIWLSVQLCISFGLGLQLSLRVLYLARKYFLYLSIYIYTYICYFVSGWWIGVGRQRGGHCTHHFLPIRAMSGSCNILKFERNGYLNIRSGPFLGACKAIWSMIFARFILAPPGTRKFDPYFSLYSCLCAWMTTWILCAFLSFKK